MQLLKAVFVAAGQHVVACPTTCPAVVHLHVAQNGAVHAGLRRAVITQKQH